MQGKELVVFLNKEAKEQFHNNILKRNFHPDYSPSLVREFYANLYDHELELIFIQEGLIPWDATTINEQYNTKVNVDEHSEFMDDITNEKCDLLTKAFHLQHRNHPKQNVSDTFYSQGPKIDVGTILHQEIVDCTARGIMPCVSEEILENKGLINEAFVEIMTRAKDTPILKEVETSKTLNDKAKVDRKGKHECIDIIMAQIEGCQKMDTVVEKEVDATEEEVAEMEKKEEEYFVEKVIPAPEYVGANIEKLQRTGARSAEFAEITNEEQCNSWAIVV
ncbi:hypothetical protein PVK06_008011 [Gossypium arboreum]|uniref:Uncharacterized protein n=1 Tax=Gossypium arboreum TaxID=29729 RepID=A0ABR0QIU5_GOSAR|nr:hypothetical protein PVK06_008011 [Gossypium arboreum]